MYQKYPDFDGHALIVSRHNAKIGFTAFIALHNEVLGPAMGGCRIVPYASEEAAVKDVLRLSRGMSYKNAIANIPYGGGKAVIIADPQGADKQVLLHEMGDFVRSLEGRYITSFDSGTTLDDVRVIGERTQYVAGTLAAAGNASGSTALGVYHCMRAAVGLRLGTESLAGVRVAIQGVGNVGGRLARLLAKDGAELVLADTNEEAVRALALEIGATVLPIDAIMSSEADILSPNALGGILNEAAISSIRAKLVVGSANNQLATPGDDERLRSRDILYCPDYVANAGGIIDLHYQRSSWSVDAVRRHVLTLADTFVEVATRAARASCGTSRIADDIALERLTPP